MAGRNDAGTHERQRGETLIKPPTLTFPGCPSNPRLTRARVVPPVSPRHACTPLGLRPDPCTKRRD